MLKKLFLFLFILLVLAVAALGGGYYYLVVKNPGDEISLANIQSILGKESPVFYSDGTTPLGVFFDEAHRQYVTWGQIPQNFVNALVASEDNRFFEHYGFDPVSIGRAAVRNYEAGRVVQGGSTLTQQTAKNLFKRSGRSYEAKLKELLYALRLEYHYSKEKIFEFYANQFYVRGNGHGLGVAARYYFDKKVEDLSLLECAFIAGSVKRPNYYNPFRRTSEKGKREARRRINERVAYVLGQMKQQGMLTQKMYEQARYSDVVFTEGQVGYELDYVMEMVKDAVSSEEVQDALEEHGIGNLATAGLRVITSVDKGLQEETLYTLRRELSRVDIRLRGYPHDEVQQELAALKYRGDQELKKTAFLFGTVAEIEQSSKKKGSSLKISVDFSARGLGSGVIDMEGIRRPLQALVKWKKNRWSEVKKSDTSLLLDQIRPGDRVWVSVREIDLSGDVLLDLERFPELKGGALILHEGKIKAMAGGVENRFFNRAVAAKRTMGSAFKPFVFSAALQLGWNSADLLNNGRDIFVYQGQAYFPRPDHKSPFQQVSMSWAGVKSENLASVWLLYHLCDQLTDEEFVEIAEHLELLPRVHNGETEPYNVYRARIRDRYGIVLNKSILKKTAYDRAVKNLETDFIFENLAEQYPILKNLHYGLYYERFRKDIEVALENDKLKSYEKSELFLRRDLLKVSFMSLTERYAQFEEFKAWIGEQIGDDESFVPQGFSNGAALYYDTEKNKYSFVGEKIADDSLSRVDYGRLVNYLRYQQPGATQDFWNEVLLDSSLSVSAFSLTKKQMQREFSHLLSLSPYSAEVLADVRDFRVLVGLQYLIAYGRELGIRSQLDPVLSFPLGSNVVTLLEAVRMYEAMVTGDVFLAGDEGTGNQDLVCILDRIETKEGEVVYQTRMRRKKLVAPKVQLALNHVLENIIKFGTGRYAKKNAKLLSDDPEDSEDFATLKLEIPLLGKTGTANNYTNASFFGYLPFPSKGGTGMVINGGYTVGTYVGFDNNLPMRRKTTRITGSSGALPAWTSLVNSIMKENGYADRLDPVDLSFYGLSLLSDDMGQIDLAVAEESGGHLLFPAEKIDARNRSRRSIMTYGNVYPTGKFKAARFFVPFWGGEEHLFEGDL